MQKNKSYHHSEEQVHCEICGKGGTGKKDIGQNRCVDHMYERKL